MMVPAIAFACWFAAVPPHAPAHAPAARLAATLDEPSADAASSQEAQGLERVKVKLVNPAMVKAAESFIKLPMGSERYATVNGKRYVFVLEQHYHPPGFIGAPNGYHKGVTMYELR